MAPSTQGSAGREAASSARDGRAPGDPLRARVFSGFAAVTAGFSALMLVGEALLRGLLAFQTLAFSVMTLLFAGLWWRARRTGATAGPATLGLGVYFALFTVIERLHPGTSEGIRVAMFGFPLAAVLLAGPRTATALWAFAASDAVVMAIANAPVERGLPLAIHWLNTAGACFVGAILIVMGAVFDRERLRAQRLAEEREASLREAVRRAEEAAEARSTFLANMSHEIRTPMNGVLGLSRVLVEEPLEPQQLELAQTILSSGQSLLHILDDILDLSKLDAGALKVDPTPTDVRTLVEEVRRLMRVKAEEVGLQIEVRGLDALPAWVEVDGHRVRQVLTNLLGNAVKFTPEGRIRVTATHHEDRLRLEVEDTGVGMAPEVLEKIFLPFEQADGSTARKFGGTGLGLAICKRLCELMGGSIWATSAPGVGSRFSFEVRAPLSDAPALTGDRSPAAPSRAMTVLVAEDNRVNQVVTRRLLGKIGVEVQIVENGREAVEAVAARRFDLVFMDLQMPEVDGLEATRRIRAAEPAGARPLPIFALTASAMEAERQQCAEAGMSGVLTKPVEIEALEATVRSVD